MNPRESALPRPVAMRLAATEYERGAEMFRSLPAAQWATATDCPAAPLPSCAAAPCRSSRRSTGCGNPGRSAT
jgi:hypothetical protein